MERTPEDRLVFFVNGRKVGSHLHLRHLVGHCAIYNNATLTRVV